MHGRLGVSARDSGEQWRLWVLTLVPLAFIVVFRVVPLYGLQIAFRDFSARRGILGSEWVGLEHFQRLFRSPRFVRIIINTLSISVLNLAINFPVPILFAIAVNEAKSKPLKKTVQLTAYAPHFISAVVMVGIVLRILDVRIGVLNRLIVWLGGDAVNFIAVPGYFAFIYALMGTWQNTGYSAIIYIATLSAIDPQLYEAAIIDGATRLQKIRHIDLPGIASTVVILLILNLGRLLAVGFQRIYLMQNALNISRSEVIATYVYKTGLLEGDFSYGAAAGLFNSVVALFLIVSANAFARRVGESSLW